VVVVAPADALAARRHRARVVGPSGDLHVPRRPAHSTGRPAPATEPRLPHQRRHDHHDDHRRRDRRAHKRSYRRTKHHPPTLPDHPPTRIRERYPRADRETTGLAYPSVDGPRSPGTDYEKLSTTGRRARLAAQARGAGSAARTEAGPAAADRKDGRSKSYPAPDDESAATGIGRSVSNDVRWVNMQLEPHPYSEISIRYEFYQGLVRLGIQPRGYQRPDSLRRRENARGFEDRRFSPEP